MTVFVRYVFRVFVLVLLGACCGNAQTVSVVWTDSTTGQILRGVVGTNDTAEILFDASDYPGAPATVAPFGIDADDNFVYWSDATTGQIFRGDIDGLGSATLLFGSNDYPGSPVAVAPTGIAIDETYVYWADSLTGEILRGNKDGSGLISALFDGADYPGSPSAVYPWEVAIVGDEIYWTDADTSQVLKGAADGSSSVQAVFTSAPDRVNLGLAIEGGNVYWGDTENEGLEGTLLRGSITGTGLPELLYDASSYPAAGTSAVPSGIVAANGQLFWVDNFTKQVLTAPAYGSGPVSAIFDAASYPGSPSVISPTFLTVVSEGYDADFDGDGDVDGRDFLAWQRGESPVPLSAGDLDLWREQFGTESPVATVQTIPEPHSMISTILAGFLAAAVRRSVWS